MKNLVGMIGFALLAAMAAPSAVAGADRDTAVAVNRFGVDLYHVLRDTTDDNLILSPLSIALALGMVLPGADEAGTEELLQAMKLPDVAAVNAGMSALHAAMVARSEAEGITLAMANRGFVQQDFALDPDYVDTLTEWYGVGLAAVDYRDPEAARATINRWVAERTNELIEELLPAGSITERARLVLANALYLLAEWKYPFDPARTIEAPFHLADGTHIEVPTMHGEFTLPVALGDTWQAVELPYAGDELALLIIVPETLDEFESTLTDAVLDTLVDTLAPRPVELWLPKVETGSRAPLKSALGALGVQRIFQAGDRLPGIAPELFVSDLFHQTRLHMDEAGTEAAAATGVVISVTSLPPQPLLIRVERPYFIALRDRTTGAMLFLGRVVDPR